MQIFSHSVNRQTCDSFGVWSFQAPSYDSVQQTAQSIAQQAHDLAYDPNYMSPFAQFACDNGLNVRGMYTDSPFNTIESIQVFMSSGSGIKIRFEMDLFTHFFGRFCLTYTFSFVFLDLQEGSQMTSQFYCPLWLNIQTEHVFQCCLSVYTCIWGWSFHPLCLSLPPAALQIAYGRQSSWHTCFHHGADDQLCPLFYF